MFNVSADHLIGSPLAFASRDYAAKAWRKFADIPALQTPQVRCVQGSCTAVDPQRKQATIRETGTDRQFELAYDYLIAASGLRRVWPTVPQALRREEYLSEVTAHIQRTENAQDGVVVIGGGK